MKMVSVRLSRWPPCIYIAKAFLNSLDKYPILLTLITFYVEVSLVSQACYMDEMRISSFSCAIFTQDPSFV